MGCLVFHREVNCVFAQQQSFKSPNSHSCGWYSIHCASRTFGTWNLTACIITLLALHPAEHSFMFIECLYCFVHLYSLGSSMLKITHVDTTHRSPRVSPGPEAIAQIKIYT